MYYMCMSHDVSIMYNIADTQADAYTLRISKAQADAYKYITFKTTI